MVYYYCRQIKIVILSYYLCVIWCRCSGYLFQKVGKLAATAVGGGLLMLQVYLFK